MYKTNATAAWIKSISQKGKEALENGEDVYENWDFERISRGIWWIRTFAGNEHEIDMDSLKLVSTDVLREYLLYKTAWHHVNHGEKVWFYALDEEVISTMQQEDIEEMIEETSYRKKIENKPRLVQVVTYEWVKSQDHHHDTQSRRFGYGVLYNNAVYFNRGIHYPLSPDQCIIVKCYSHCPKGWKDYYNGVRKGMRTCGIYC